jgi:hypothetical protein
MSCALGYACSAATGQCVTAGTCAADSDCVTGFYCDATQRCSQEITSTTSCALANCFRGKSCNQCMGDMPCSLFDMATTGTCP